MTYAELLRHLQQVAHRDRQPLQATLALTHRCNLSCVHCYLNGCGDFAELDTDGWLEVLHQVVEAGCLIVTLTGGEPLIRVDFPRIYQHAKKLGLLVTVMTNGTLINRSILELFEQWPPHCVDLSIYAWKPSTYRSITGRDVQNVVYQSVDELLKRRVRVMTKTVVLRGNLAEVASIQAWAEERGLPHRTDADICPTYCGGRSPLRHRLSNDAILRHEAKSGALARRMERVSVSCKTDNQRFRCGAGRNAFHVHPDGRASLCLLDRPEARDVNLLGAWRGPLGRRREALLSPEHPCFGCEVRPFCDACPPLLRMELGSEEKVCDDRCELARLRARAVAAREA